MSKILSFVIYLYTYLLFNGVYCHDGRHSQMNKCIHKWMKEWMYKYMDEWMGE